MVKPVLYLLCGLVSDEAVWEGQRQALADIAEIRVRNFTVEDSIPAMAAAIFAQAPAHFAVAGHSMGGRVAMEILRRAPKRVDRLALLNTGTHPPAAGETQKRQQFLDLAKNEGMAGFAAWWLPPMLAPQNRDNKALAERMTAMVLRASPEILEAQVKALLGRSDAMPALAMAKCPTLLLTGAEDGWSPVAQHQAMLSAVPHANLVIVPDCGHMSLVEQPDRVSAALRAWMLAG